MEQSDGSESSSTGGRQLVREPYERFSSYVLRRECYLRGVPPTKSGPYANYNKAGFMALLRRFDAASTTTEQQRDPGSPNSGADAVVVNESLVPPRDHAARAPSHPTRHCALRLLNVLFSDPLASRLLLGEATDASSATFWRDVRGAFVSDAPAFDLLVTEHECVRGIDPSRVVVGHKPTTLKSMWRAVARRHQRACSVMMGKAKAPLTGTPLAPCGDFFAFCRGRADVYYLHCWLQRRPDLIGAVVADCSALVTTCSTTVAAPVGDDTQSPSMRLAHLLVPDGATAGNDGHGCNKCPASAMQVPSSTRDNSSEEEQDQEDEVQVVQTSLLRPTPIIPSWGDQAEQERINTQTQRQLIDVIDCIERLRAQMCRYAPGSMAYREISDDFYWFQSRKRRLQARLDAQ